MGEARRLWPPNFNFQTKQGPNISVSNIRDIVFCGYSEFWIIYGSFSFFFLLHRGNRSLHVGPSEKVRYLTLDLLKSFFLWAIRKKTTMT